VSCRVVLNASEFDFASCYVWLMLLCVCSNFVTVLLTYSIVADLLNVCDLCSCFLIIKSMYATSQLPAQLLQSYECILLFVVSDGRYVTHCLWAALQVVLRLAVYGPFNCRVIDNCYMLRVVLYI
jgi:hypothetical protein